MFELRDEVEYFCCINCKSYGSMYESLTTNAEDFPLMLDEEWEWAEESLLEEKINPDDEIDLSKEGKDLAKEIKKLKKAVGKKQAKEILKRTRGII